LANDGNYDGDAIVLEANITTFNFINRIGFLSYLSTGFTNELSNLTHSFQLFATEANETAYNNWNFSDLAIFTDFYYDLKTKLLLNTAWITIS
jgi:hypothetical protein